MWPFVPISEVDWSDTAAMLAALAAIFGVIWQSRSLSLQNKRTALINRANLRQAWLNELRHHSSNFIAQIATVLAVRNITDRSFETLTATSDNILLLLHEKQHAELHSFVKSSSKIVSSAFKNDMTVNPSPYVLLADFGDELHERLHLLFRKETLMIELWHQGETT